MSSAYPKKEVLLTGKHGKQFLADITFPSTSFPAPVIIFSHGFKGFKDWGPFNLVADHFASQGFIFIKFNFAFNGTTLEHPLDFTDLDSFGNNNFSKELDDLDCVIQYVQINSEELKAIPSKLHLIGHSRGGGISILKGNEDDRVSSVITWASVAEFARHISKSDILKWKRDGVLHIENARTNQMMPLYIQLYHDYIQNHRRFNIRNAIQKITKPVLLTHGTSDETVPVSHARELHRLSGGKVLLLEINGGDHTFGSAHPYGNSQLTVHFSEVINSSVTFLKSL